MTEGQIAAVSREPAQDIKLSECDIQYKECDVGRGLKSRFQILCADFGSVPCEAYDDGGLYGRSNWTRGGGNKVGHFNCLTNSITTIIELYWTHV
jgi:hypothetical protein